MDMTISPAPWAPANPTQATVTWTIDGYAYRIHVERVGLGWHWVGPVYKRLDPTPRYGPNRSRKLDIDAASNRKLKRELETFLADTARIDQALVDLANAEERERAERVAQVRADDAAAIRERLRPYLNDPELGPVCRLAVLASDDTLLKLAAGAFR